LGIRTAPFLFEFEGDAPGTCLLKGAAVGFDKLVDGKEQRFCFGRRIAELPVVEVEGTMLGGKVEAVAKDHAAEIRSEGQLVLGERLVATLVALGLGPASKIVNES